MKRLILILLFNAIGQCYGLTLNLDTVDNWQIYNGKHLLLAGHGSPTGSNFQATIKAADLEDLEIQFNHCVGYNDVDVTIGITDDKGKQILTKKFKVNSGDRMTIYKKELGELTSKVLLIRYVEKRKNGTDVMLGQIRLE